MSGHGFARRLLAATAIALGVLALVAFTPAQARDAYVLISGGGSPFGNNYSQYLQARAYVKYLYENFPKDSIWVFFGAGNVTGKPAVLSDVVEEVADRSGTKRTVYAPGALPNNRPARHDEIARAFRTEILPAVHDGGTLYLFVGDHGEPSDLDSPDDNPESVISLWSWNRDPEAPFGWREYPGTKETLGVAELRRWLLSGLGAGKVVFVMSQCFSGGFHYLGIPSAVAPNSHWFARVPPWADEVREAHGLPRAAGFTSTDAHSFASGCTPDAKADRWAGYERYLPENLVGFDLFTLQSAGVRRNSLYAAHVEAVKVDQTIDLPRSTSDQYLTVWARTIAHMAHDPAGVREDVKPYLKVFRRVMDGAEPRAEDAAFNERAAFFRGSLQAMAKSNPRVRELLTAKEARLLRIIQEDVDDDDEGDDRGPMTHRDALMKSVILPAWKHGIEKGEVDLAAPLVAFERDVLKLDEVDDPFRPSMSAGRSETDLPAAVYWYGGYGDPRHFNESRAREVEAWARDRNHRIAEWAKRSANGKVRAAAKTYLAALSRRSLPRRGVRVQREERPDRVTAAQRVLFCREVLAAWQFLLKVKELPALERISALTALERTPFPLRREKNEQAP